MLYALHIACSPLCIHKSSRFYSVFTTHLRRRWVWLHEKNEDYKGVNLRIRPAQAQRHTFRHLVLLQGLLQPSRRIQTVS